MVIARAGERTIMRMKRLIFAVCSAVGLMSLITFAGVAAEPFDG